jgi:hypothetical protein
MQYSVCRASGRSRTQLGRRRLRQEEGRLGIGREQLVPLRGRGAADGRGVEGAGVVHQRVEPAEARQRGLDQGGGRLVVGQVRAQQQHAAGAHGLELGRQRLRRLARGAVVQGQVVARRVQAAGDACTDPPGGAGDQDYGTGIRHSGLRAIAGILRAGT